MKITEVPPGQNIYDITYKDILTDIEDGERFYGKTEQEVIAKFEASFPHRKILRIRCIWKTNR